jgi:hypothetical protein
MAYSSPDGHGHGRLDAKDVGELQFLNASHEFKRAAPLKASHEQVYITLSFFWAPRNSSCGPESRRMTVSAPALAGQRAIAELRGGPAPTRRQK